MRLPLPGGSVALAPRLGDYWLTVVRRTWRGSVVSSFLSPLLYILAMGVLLGGFVHADPSRLEGATSYLAFVAPGMLAAQVMTSCFGEMSYPVMAMIKWTRVYDGMLASPLGVGDVVAAQLGYLLIRVAVIAAVFSLVLAPFGVYTSLVGAVLAWLVQLLVGLCFGALVFAWSAWVPTEEYYSLIFRLGMIPMFLFSGAFFPVANLSPPLELLARFTPLWHGVDLTRMLFTGRLDAAWALVHVAYLLALGLLGWWLTVRYLSRKLAS